MRREERILIAVDRTRQGLEIGASYNPVAPKRLGFDVKILDHLDRLGLIEKYRPFVEDVTKIEEVDYIWSGERYIDLIRKDQRFGWIIASHIIEHTPDLMVFLKDCESLLAEGGVLSLAVPDKRYCLDRFRQKTSLAAVIDRHHDKRTRVSPGIAAEYYLYVVTRNGNTSWHHGVKGEDKLVHSTDDAKAALSSSTSAGAYVDVHSWCFTPHSFRLLVEDLYQLGLTKLREYCFFGTEGCEFYITLSVNGAGPRMGRLELLKLSDAD